MSSKTFKNQR